MFVIGALGVARSNAQGRTLIAGRYLLDVVRRDSTGQTRVIDRLLLVMIEGPMPSSVTRAIDGVDLVRVPAAASRGACWRSASADPKVEAKSIPIHTQWTQVGDSVTVLLWASVDAGQRIGLVVDSTGAHGDLDWWAWNGDHGRDSLVGRRFARTDPVDCLAHGPPN
jgi:hypothetical protein